MSSKIRLQAIGLLFGYGLQFLAGMSLNLFVKLPSSHSGTSGSQFIPRASHGLIWALSGSGGWVLAFHAYLALALVLGSITLFICCLASNFKIWKWVSGITALFTLGAFFNGLSFISYNHNANSMVMASCWLIAVGSLMYGLVKTHNTK